MTNLQEEVVRRTTAGKLSPLLSLSGLGLAVKLQLARMVEHKGAST